MHSDLDIFSVCYSRTAYVCHNIDQLSSKVEYSVVVSVSHELTSWVHYQHYVVINNTLLSAQRSLYFVCNLIINYIG